MMPPMPANMPVAPMAPQQPVQNGASGGGLAPMGQQQVTAGQQQAPAGQPVFNQQAFQPWQMPQFNLPQPALANAMPESGIPLAAGPVSGAQPFAQPPAPAPDPTQLLTQQLMGEPQTGADSNAQQMLRMQQQAFAQQQILAQQQAMAQQAWQQQQQAALASLLPYIMPQLQNQATTPDHGFDPVVPQTPSLAAAPLVPEPAAAPAAPAGQPVAQAPIIRKRRTGTYSTRGLGGGYSTRG